MPENEPNRDQMGKVQREVFRKSIHIAGFIVPFIAITFGLAAAISFVIALSLLYCISEYARLKGKRFPVLTKITNLAVRSSHNGETESSFVRAPIYLAGGIVASLLIFPYPVSYVAIAAVTLGDGSAAIVGRLYGRIKIPYLNKTIEGTVTGLVCAFAGSLVFVSPVTALVAAGVGMLVELVPWRISDNLTVPLLAGLAAAIAVATIG